jgi:hypothetical protein
MVGREKTAMNICDLVVLLPGIMLTVTLGW